MEAQSLNGITSHAIQWSRPGRWSWLALLLFIGSLLVAVQFRGSIVEQMQYREHFGDAASLATLNDIILGFSTALVVAAAVISWRAWWTFSLIGTTALGMPDLGAMGFIWLRTWAARLASKALAFVRNNLWPAISIAFIYLGKGIAFAGKHLGLGIKAVFLVLWRVLAFVRNNLWPAISIAFIYLGKGIAFAGKHLGLGIKAVFLVLWRVLAFAGKHLGLGIKAVFLMLWRVLALAGRHLALGIKAVFLALWRVLAFAGKYLGMVIKAVFLMLWRVLTFAGKYLGLGIKAVFLVLWRVLAFAGKHLGLGIKAVFLLWRPLAFAGKYLALGIETIFLMLWRVLAFAGKYLGLAISIPFIYLGKGIAWTVKSQGSGVALLLRGLLLGPIRELAFASRPVGRAVSGFFQNQATGLQSLGRYLWATAYTMGHDLQAGLRLLGRYAAGTLAAPLQASTWGWASARATPERA
jgi:hypothetical protein